MRTVAAVSVVRLEAGEMRQADDAVAVEEPLELRCATAGSSEPQPLNVTMRTPGDDLDWAYGFLFTEGLIASAHDVVDAVFDGQTVTVTLRPGLALDPTKVERNFYVSSSCGVCGKASLEAVQTVCPEYEAPVWRVAPEVLHALPTTLRDAQRAFGLTGGIHAAGWFDRSGALLAHREDVGRHNALDKLLGHALRTGHIPLNDSILLLSGRASFELLQKSAMAGIQLVCAVGAPSSLAIELANTFGITLIGFLRDDRLNIYCGNQRVEGGG
jgi:FdhD protein